MKTWNTWGIVLFILNIIFSVIYTIIAVGAQMAASHGSS